MYAFRLHGNQRLEEGTAEIFTLFTSGMDRLNSSQLQGVYMNYIPIVEDLPLHNIFLYDVDNVEGYNINELARRSL